MEKYQTIYNSICRLCLRYSDSKKMVSLIDVNSQDGLTPYAKAASTFARISLTKQDCYPNNMCIQCLYLLKQAIHFKLVTESSDSCLKNLKNSIGSDSVKLKEKIIEFTMLKFYFPTECFKTTEECSNIHYNHNTNSNERSYVNRNTKINNKLEHKRFTSFNDDSFDCPDVESEPERDISIQEVITLNKIDNCTSANHKPPVSVQKVFNKKKKDAKTECPKVNVQYKRSIVLKRKRKLKKNITCNICNKVMANQFTYKNHMQRHNGCRYICEYCGKGYPVLHLLHVHQITKHNIGPYLQCSHCPFRAPGKQELTEHERIHSGERPFACDKCGLTFRRRAIWRKHLVHHAEKEIQCLQCPKKFYRRSEMLAHANNIHDRLYVYSCSECNATYNATDTVRRHMTVRHGIPREMQGKIVRVNRGSSCQR